MKSQTKIKTGKSDFYFMIGPSLLILFLAFSMINLEFVGAESKNATVNVTAACTMSTTSITTHLYALNVNSYQEDLGKTKLTAICNDASGFVIYAIGFSGDTYGNTNMVNANGYTIATGTGVDETTSNWSMRLVKDMDSYVPSNLGIESGYQNYKVIPANYTKVITYTARTTPESGAAVISSYAVNISGTQPSGSYTGKVKYTMVHPANEAAPEI